MPATTESLTTLTSQPDSTPVMEHLIQDAQQGSWDGLKSAARGNAAFADAPCTEADPDAFFVPGDDPYIVSPTMRAESRTRLEHARSFCAECPLQTRAACLVSALELNDHYGVRGGLSAVERRPLHSAWHQQVDEEKVHLALDGTPVDLTDGERDRVVQLFAENPEASATTIARSTGMTRTHLYWRRHQHRKHVASAGTAETAAA